MDSATTYPRPWRVVAAEITTEHDPNKITKLVFELNRALDQQCIGVPDGMGDGSSHEPKDS
jgi:hypothetical protein